MEAAIRQHPKGLHSLTGGGKAAPQGEGIELTASPELEEFVRVAAQAGLSLSEAMRLAIERALLLADAVGIGLDYESARRRLCTAAAGARPHLSITAAEAARVRALSNPRSVASIEIGSGRVMPVPDRVLARARGRVPVDALRADLVAEMVSWEIAATLSGRTIGEWGLLVLSGGAA